MNPVHLFKPHRLADERGWFAEVYHKGRLQAAGINVDFVQENHSLSRAAGTLRGLHCQSPPHAQAKLIRCIAGRIHDVAVDIRAGSPTFGHHVGVELTAENGWQIYIPAGFAHGFLTLVPDCEVIYQVSAHYAPDGDVGIAWDDPDLAIAWPLPGGAAPVLSEKDRRLGCLRTFQSSFAYDGCPLQPLPLQPLPTGT